jgi:hypothetical protein
MEQEMHYHICWSDSKLDWERFRTRQEAEGAARELARPGETFTVNQHDDRTCMQCRKLYKGGPETNEKSASSDVEV